MATCWQMPHVKFSSIFFVTGSRVSMRRGFFAAGSSGSFWLGERRPSDGQALPPSASFEAADEDRRA